MVEAVIAVLGRCGRAGHPGLAPNSDAAPLAGCRQNVECGARSGSVSVDHAEVLADPTAAVEAVTIVASSEECGDPHVVVIGR